MLVYIVSSPNFFIGCFLSPRYNTGRLVLFVLSFGYVLNTGFFSRSICFRGFCGCHPVCENYTPRIGAIHKQKEERKLIVGKITLLNLKKNPTNREKNRPQETRLTVYNNTVTKSRPKSSHRLYVIYVPTNVFCIESPSGGKITRPCLRIA